MMPDLSPQDALAAAGAIAITFLEIEDPAELAIVQRCVPAAMVAMAVLMVEQDPAFKARWAAAGTDWLTRGELLHESLMFLLTPKGRELT